MKERALFVFRRDLRLSDNTGLLFALEHFETVIPAFIFTPEQVDKNPYKSEACFAFMIESLEDLDADLRDKGSKLYLFYGKNEEVVADLIEREKLAAVVVNRDYTPYSLERDRKLEMLCKREKVEFHSFDDALLQPPEAVAKADGKPYTIFTPFYRAASAFEVAKPIRNVHSNYFKGKIEGTSPMLKAASGKRASRGGRKECLKILKHRFSDYTGTRDFPALDATTHLSAHLKFTTCSVREIYSALSEEPLRRQLYWRDFFSHIAFHFPKVFGHPFHEKYDKISWKEDKKAFAHWCEGTTGFPIVDAGMREMNETGFMHNRVRMIAASFLIKDLHIDWRKGEKYFAQKLIDYDPAVNNGNWQWVAGTGCDAAPYFRIFNPWTQQEKFDPDCKYIKTWIPELKKYTPKEIHNWEGSLDYPEPICDHAKEAKETLRRYKR